MASQSSLLGAAGEHHVMSELLRRGYIAALAPAGVPNADIIVTDLSGERLCSIQVKTRRDVGSDGGWHMQAKHEHIETDRLFYCFVDLGASPEDKPITHVLPSRLVAKALRETHAHWLASPGAKGQARNDSKVRRLLPDYRRLYGSGECPYPSGWLDPYLSRWDELKLESQPLERQAD